MKALRLSRAALCLAMFSALVATAMAAVVSTTTTIAVPSVQSDGNPSYNVYGVGSGKLYKDTHLGILTGTFKAKILNKSKASAKFENQGLSINDPWDGSTVTATKDSQTVSKPVSYWSKAVVTVTYNPLEAIDD